MNFTENHLAKIKKILDSNQALFRRLELVGEYLIETNRLSCVSIFRRAGDEMDDHIFVSNRSFLTTDFQKGRVVKQKAEHFAMPIQIVSSKFKKQKCFKISNDPIPEFVIPIIRIREVVGFLHAEKGVGNFFNPKEVRLLKETANLIGKLFIPSVIHLN